MPDACRSAISGAAAAALLGMGLLAWSGAAEGGVYKWVDENGITHYTVDRAAIPQHLRSPLDPTGLRTAVPPPAAPVALPPDVDPEDFEGVAPQDVQTALGLDEKIERDRDLIKDMISRPGVTGPELANDPAMREIADRLPQLQDESEKLKQAKD